MDRTFYHVADYTDLVLVAIALGFAIAWPSRKGKGLLVASLVLGVLGTLIFDATSILAEHMDVTLVLILGRLAHLAAGALLLAFVIAAGTAPGRVMVEDRPGGIFSMRGRYNRARYFWTSFFLALICNLIPSFLVGLAREPLGDAYPIAAFFVMAIALAGAVLAAFQVVKRLHDLGRPGWHYWLLLIPLYNIYLALVLLFVKGTPGPNPYGVDPLMHSEGVAQLEPTVAGRN